MTDLISRQEIKEKLKGVNMSITDVTMQRYANLNLIEKPVFSSEGRGARAYYPADTVERIFAIYNLMSLRSIPVEKMKFIIRVGAHLETQKYRSYADVINDETDDDPLAFRMGEYGDLAFFIIEYLRLKKSARQVLRPDKPLSTIMQKRKFEILSDRQTLYSIITGPTSEKEPLPFVTQGLLVMIANGENELLSRLK